MDKLLTVPGLLLPLLGLALLASCGADARVAKETPLLTRALPDVPGREVLIETVVLAPGKVVPAHRHSSDAAVAIDAKVDLRLTRLAPAVSFPLHPDRLLLVESCRALLRRDHPQAPAPGHLPQCADSYRRHSPLRPRT